VKEGKRAGQVLCFEQAVGTFLLELNFNTPVGYPACLSFVGGNGIL